MMTDVHKNTNTCPVTLEFRNITYTVSNRSNYWPLTKDERTTILNGVSGVFYPGTLTAIMGPSGAGKTSLLDILAGDRSTCVTGQVLINGIQRSQHVPLRHLHSYILQEDHLLPHITVAEAMAAAAALKLGAKVPAEQRAANVNDILSKLGLQSCCNIMCSRISGGQRKRLSIALELINNPPIMFFDEPTSGLDSASCSACIALLRTLARQGHTVVCTVHQPSSRIFQQFDQLYLLADGGCIYRGARGRLLNYLSTAAGLHCPDFHNPADFVIEVASGEFGDWNRALCLATLNGKSSRYTRPKVQPVGHPVSPDVCVLSDTASLNKVSATRARDSSASVLLAPGDCGQSDSWPLTVAVPPLSLAKSPTTAAAAAAAAAAAEAVAAAVDNRVSADGCASSDDQQDSADEDGVSSREAISLKAHLPTTACHQFTVLLARTMKTILRNKMITSVRLVSYVTFGLLMAALYYNVGNKAERVHNNAAHIFFDLMFIVFSSLMPTILTFPLEMSVFKNEHRNGWYTVKAYYLAKTMADLPFQMLLPLVYNVIVYTLTGQPREWRRFGKFSLIMALAALISQSVGLLIGASCSIQMAVFLGPVSMMPAILFCGFFVSSAQLPAALSWLSPLAFTSYAFEGLLLSVLGDGRQPLHCSQPYCHYRQPARFLQELSLSETGYGLDVAVLLLMALLLRSLGYIVLRWKVSRQR